MEFYGSDNSIGTTENLTDAKIQTDLKRFFKHRCHFTAEKWALKSGICMAFISLLFSLSLLLSLKRPMNFFLPLTVTMSIPELLLFCTYRVTGGVPSKRPIDEAVTGQTQLVLLVVVRALHALLTPAVEIHQESQIFFSTAVYKIRYVSVNDRKQRR